MTVHRWVADRLTSGYDPSAPDMGLSRNFIDRLISEVGRVGDF